MEEFSTLDDIDLENKTVLLRVDFNMPLDRNTLGIVDDTRIRRVLPTVQELAEKNAKTVILAHQGRPGSWDFTSLEKHAQVLGRLLHKNVNYVGDIYGEKAQIAIKNLQESEVLILDNVRKFSEEKENKSPGEHARSELVQNLYPLADIFVNDAFAAAHRAHCSLVGFTTVLPSYAGRLMEKEVITLKDVVTNPKKPSVFLFGGAKFSDVIVTINRLLSNNTADKIILTGLPANAFLKAKGVDLGESNEKALSEEEKPDDYKKIKDIASRFEDSIYLPRDFGIEKNGGRTEIDMSDLPTPYNIYDIGGISIEECKKILTDAKTVFLSGPCGVFEHPAFIKGTKEIFTYVANSNAFSIVGGGHTVAAVNKLGLEDKISHISTGGGSLERFMMGEKLPVIEALKQAKKQFSEAARAY